MNIPIAYVILKLGFPVYYTTIAFVILEIISLCTRLYMATKLTGMKVFDYCNEVIIPTMKIIIIPIIIAMIPHCVLEKSLLRIFIVCVVYCSLFIALMFRFAIDESLRFKILCKVKNIIKR